MRNVETIGEGVVVVVPQPPELNFSKKDTTDDGENFKMVHHLDNHHKKHTIQPQPQPQPKESHTTVQADYKSISGLCFVYSVWIPHARDYSSRISWETRNSSFGIFKSF
mmetsp:Transcript_3581/g.4781  ORF Transcript_3581/g.4781 Transcript_3581/m.4781 type:complete len:109 (+) Transcript_3581:277-603(+)